MKNNDLISRSALIAKYDRVHVGEPGMERKLMEDAHTVDAVPVMHGRWVNNGIPDSMLSGCSVCGCPYGSSGFRYCPHCGAKMDGDEE